MESFTAKEEKWQVLDLPTARNEIWQVSDLPTTKGHDMINCRLIDRGDNGNTKTQRSVDGSVIVKGVSLEKRIWAAGALRNARLVICNCIASRNNLRLLF